MNRCYGYIRVSKDPNKDKLSPDIQRQLIERYARKERLELVEIFGDVDVPSRKIEFAGTWAKLADSLKPTDLIITNDSSRLGRDLYETLTRAREVARLGAEVISLEGNIETDRAAGKFAFHVLLATAQFINDQLSERMQAMHAYKAQRGEWSGGGTPPFGYTYRVGAKKLEVLEPEARVVREMYQLRDRGWSYNAISRDMADRGIAGKKGRMNYSSVKQILINPTYAGKRAHRGEIYEGLHDAVIEQGLWERVQARNRQSSTKEAAARRWLLSGLCVCGECGSKMVYWTGESKGRKRRTIQCKEAKMFKTSKMVTIEAHLAEEWVLAQFFSRMNNRRIDEAEGRAKKRAPKRETRAQELRRRLDQVQTSLSRLESDRYDHDEPLIDAEQFRKKNQELIARRADFVVELGILEDEAKLDNVIYLEIARERRFRESWEGLTLDEQREALRLFVDRVVVSARTGEKKVDPDRLKIVWK
jgi:site-specific DNA recombinase